MAYTNGSWVSEGTIITPTTFGLAAGSVVADGTAIETSGGGVRIYIFADDVVKSLSSSDGVHFTADSGSRTATGAGMPKITQTGDGTYRLYYQQFEGIRSATGSDGLTFTEESGTRITYASTGQAKISAPDLLTLNGTTYAYYGDVDAVAGSGINTHVTYVATTSDGVTFTLDNVARIGSGSSIADSAEHPDAIVNDEGGVTVFYSNNQVAGMPQIYYASSSDGLTFTASTSTGIDGNDPFVLRTSDGTLRLYSGDFSSSVGGFVNSARWVENVSTASTSGADTITGTSHANIISGQDGADVISGAEGADIVYGNVGGDLLYGNKGIDTIFGGKDSDTVYGGQQNDVVYGNFANDIVYGNLGDDTIYGGQDEDYLYGGSGNDSLLGNLGNDNMWGGAGNDTFAFGNSSGIDTIHDFASGDVIAIKSNANANGITSFSLLQASMTTTADGHTQIDLGSGNLVIIGNTTTSQLSSTDFSFF